MSDWMSLYFPYKKEEDSGKRNTCYQDKWASYIM